MSVQKVILLHGPINSVGINPVTQYIYQDPFTRVQVGEAFSCTQNIIALSLSFRALGFKVCYSGWSDDAEWLEKNRGLFDYLVVSDQTNLKSKSVRGEFVFPNNKEKLYYSVYQGLCEIEKNFSDEEVVVFRLRSDISVNPRLAEPEVTKVIHNSKIVVIECLYESAMLTFPDFMMVADLHVMKEIYESMYRRSASGNAYHLSSHIDHSLTCIEMQQKGLVQVIQCMGKDIYDSVVWRGVPRYFEYMFEEFSKHPMFDCVLNVPSNFNISQVVAAIPETLSGKDSR